MCIGVIFRIFLSSQHKAENSLSPGDEIYPESPSARCHFHIHYNQTFLVRAHGLSPLGVIAAVVFVLICLLVVMVRYMYRHKGTYHTNEAKGTEFAESADAALKNDPALQEAVDESKKEYFI
uniref:Glycophorin C (Gerbich blood group) n=1 Tax=Malurus cyaneus samueli TaxID=2593467 RepID=A0A8C5TT99_9PASS